MKLDVKHYDERGVFVKKLLYCLKYLHYLTFFNSVYHFQHVSVCFGLAVTSSAHSIFSFIFSLCHSLREKKLGSKCTGYFITLLSFQKGCFQKNYSSSQTDGYKVLLSTREGILSYPTRFARRFRVLSYPTLGNSVVYTLRLHLKSTIIRILLH